MNNIAIVIPCYKRLDTLNELCDSLLRANYDDDKITLIFSIDFSGTDEVSKYANTFIWPHGKKKVVCHPCNIGLRKNILFCGDLTNEFDAVIVIEDDLEVMPDFYRFAKQAAEFYDNDNRIAGVSIYQYYLDEMSFNPFFPIQDGSDAYMIKWASSWGQLWTKKQWTGFRTWYKENMDISEIKIPAHVKSWKKSWKKFYIAYLTDTGRYFIFPYRSFILNANKAGGVHTASFESSLMSSPLNIITKEKYKFHSFNDVVYKYDAFFQLEMLSIECQGTIYSIELDLNGNKDCFSAPYVITARTCNSNEIICGFCGEMLPVELNVLTMRPGNIYFLMKSSQVNMKSLPASSRVLRMKNCTNELKSFFILLKKMIKSRLNKK